jgi:hypothetical protein
MVMMAKETQWLSDIDGVSLVREPMSNEAMFGETHR